MNNYYTFWILVAICLFLLFAMALVVFIHIKSVRKTVQRANTDTVTGALNSSGFAAQGQKLLAANASAYSVVVMELQNYSQVLQTFGTEKCEQVLAHLCNTVKAHLSNMEPVARIYNGTFCFLLKNQQESQIRNRLTRIQTTVNQCNQYRQVPYTLELTFGIYIPKDNSRSLAQMQESVIALVHTRETSDLHFYKEDSEGAPGFKWELIQQIDQSLKSGDFQVYLQPKVRLSDQRIVGAEALTRWRHPQKGVLTPEMFLPLLEEYHLISQLDLYLFEHICKYLSSWISRNWTPCPISFNLSKESLMSESFIHHCENICKIHHIDPELIEFELREAFLAEQPQKLYDLAKQIHACGFRCALDNFGRSHIPVHLLREIDIDAIKLDRSFFASENNSRRNRLLVDSILKFTTQMKISVVAEGIDNASQIQYLQQAGCEQVQGFYYFRPMPIDEFQKTVYQDGNLRYITQDGSQLAVRQAAAGGSDIVMFSLITKEDKLILSEVFSPLQEGQTVLENVTPFLRYSELIHENDRDDFFELLEHCAKETGWVSNTLRFYTSKGRYEWLEVRMHKEISLSAGEWIISGTLINMAGFNHEVDRWKEKANRDALTGLYNRAHFETVSTELLTSGTLSSSAILFVDIDDFKKVNDTLGHVIGDDVIRCIAKRILGTFRHTDIVARYGGDEFVVFVNEISRVELYKRLQQLCDGFRFPYSNETVEYPISGSIGVAMFPEDGSDYLQLLDHADAALYAAKQQGKNRFVFYRPGMEGSVQE